MSEKFLLHEDLCIECSFHFVLKFWILIGKQFPIMFRIQGVHNFYTNSQYGLTLIRIWIPSRRDVWIVMSLLPDVPFNFKWPQSLINNFFKTWNFEYFLANFWYFTNCRIIRNIMPHFYFLANFYLLFKNIPSFY